MSNTQAERAVNQLYESDTLRSELRDEEASLLLSWGESRIYELADRNLPDDQFDQLNDGLRALLVAINVCVGKRKTSPSQHLSMMATISSTAEAAGYTFPTDDQTAFLKHQTVLANQDAISELLGLLKPAEASPTVSQTIVEAAAESVAEPEPSPVVADNVVAPQLEEVAAESVPEPEPPAVVDDVVGELNTSIPGSFSVSSEGEPTPEISADQTDSPIVPVNNSTPPPQPEELPEIPPQSPQEG